MKIKDIATVENMATYERPKRRIKWEQKPHKKENAKKKRSWRDGHAQRDFVGEKHRIIP